MENELSIFIPLLGKAGVLSFHVILADHANLNDTIPPANHPYFSEEGCFLKFFDLAKRVTSLPICSVSVGGLESPHFIEEQLKAGRITCTAMSR